MGSICVSSENFLHTTYFNLGARLRYPFLSVVTVSNGEDIKDRYTFVWRISIP